MSAHDHQWMAEALRLAARGKFSTHPNPAVGCIILKNGQLISSGFHEVAGRAHAEIRAIESNAIPAGSEFFITLEPCSHHGKTGPCVEAVINCQPSRVVIAMSDPNPQVAGRGIKQLREAGIETVVGVLQKQAESLNAGFVKRMRTGKPLVSLKMACSLDGKTALSNGNSKWISGEASRLDVQFLRASAAAILSTAATVKADDARLNVRLDAEDLKQQIGVRQPIRVVVDRNLLLDGSESLFDIEGDIWIYTSQSDAVKANNLKAKGVKLIDLPGGDSDQQLHWLMNDLASREINSLHCECGPGFAGALLEAGIVDQLIVYQAPCLLGDKGKPLVCLGDITQMQNRFNLSLTDYRRFDGDSRMIFSLE